MLADLTDLNAGLEAGYRPPMTTSTYTSKYASEPVRSGPPLSPSNDHEIDTDLFANNATSRLMTQKPQCAKRG